MANKTKRFQILSFTLLFSACLISAQEYEITLNAPDFNGSEVILAEYFTSRMVPKDTIVLDKKGKGTFSGERLEGGLYIVYFNSKYYFDFLLDKDQNFKISTDSADLIKYTVFEGSEDNELFYDYKRFIADKRRDLNKLREALDGGTSPSDSIYITEQIDQLNKDIEKYLAGLLEETKGTFFSTFISATQDVKIPELDFKGTDRQRDSVRYVYYKNHYFDNFDVSDIRLIHSPIYEPKILTYINKVATQHPDSLILAVDKLIEKSRSNEAIFRYMLITLFNNYAESKIMGMDKVYFHIAEKYYIPEADWSSADFIKKLSENLEKSRYTFINSIAPDIALKGIPRDHFFMAEMDTAIKNDPHIGFDFHLSDINARYTLLYFWESDCGHCQKSTPKLYEVFEKYKDQDVKAVVVHVINSVEGKVKWIDFVNEHEIYDWINCWSPYSNDFRKTYNLMSFPQLFLLDREKKIIAKTISPEQVDDILKRLLN